MSVMSRVVYGLLQTDHELIHLKGAVNPTDQAEMNVRGIGIKPVAVVKVGAGNSTVKATPGRILAIYSTDALTILDGADAVFAVEAGKVHVFAACPIECSATSIVLTFAAGGTAYVQYE